MIQYHCLDEAFARERGQCFYDTDIVYRGECLFALASMSRGFLFESQGCSYLGSVAAKNYVPWLDDGSDRSVTTVLDMTGAPVQYSAVGCDDGASDDHM